MPSYVPPKKNAAFVMYVGLPDADDSSAFKASPTLAAGDVKISKDGGAFANVTNLPAVTPAAGKSVQLSLTATEMDADNVVVVFSDQTATEEWNDVVIHIHTAARQVDDLAYPTVSGRSIDVDATGGVEVGAIGNNVVTAASIAADAVTEIQSGLATSAALTAAQGDITLVKAKTDNLPTDPADQSLIIAATDAIVALVGDVPNNAEFAAAMAVIDADFDATNALIGGLPAPISASAIATAVHDFVVEGAYTFKQVTRLSAASLLGTITGAEAAAPVVFKGIDGTTTRITMTGDQYGNRSAPTFNVGD
jgi:hypothetical protein